MSKRQKQDSQQEKVVERNDEMYEALRQSNNEWVNIPVKDLRVGDWMVSKFDQKHARALRAEKVVSIEPSRHIVHCIVNGKYVYTYGGFAEVLYMPHMRGMDNLIATQIMRSIHESVQVN